MRLQKSSKLLNEWEALMNQSDSFNALKSHDHSSSFDGLGSWLDQQSKRPKPMKKLSKIAASFIIGTLVLLACTVPVQHEEEIGYMIKGIVTEQPELGKGKIANLSVLVPNEVQFIPIIHEKLDDGSTSEAKELTEVVVLLPEANLQAAETKLAALESVLTFITIDVLPIEETVERTFFESAMHKTFDVKIDPELTEYEVAAKINVFLHENSSITDEVEIELDEEGNRKAVFRINLNKNGKGATYEVKRDIEQLYNDLTPEVNQIILEDFAEEELIETKKAELEKMNQIIEESENQ